MSFPRINSLSTVGILKHYIQDYWLHSIRTDFVGANGSGKSIIADLLQLLFVYEADLIKFGTDGVRKDKRTIQSIPHECSTGYCFISVEVSADKFVILGTAIPRTKGVRIMPFIVLKSANLDAEFEANLLRRDELILAADFIVEDHIPDLTMLARHLQNRGLWLTPFKRRDTVNNYYDFLYQNGILPINLTRSDNLKAFAKVIQSFSKAKALQLDSSASIKGFLFDEADVLFTNEFEEHEKNLSDLLTKYEQLLKYIEDLEAKQKALVALKEHENSRDRSGKFFRKAQVVFKRKQFGVESEMASKHQQTLNAEKKILGTLTQRVETLPGLITSANKSVDEVNEAFGKLADAEKLLKQIEELTAEATNMNVANSLTIPDSYNAALSDSVPTKPLVKWEDLTKQTALLRPIISRYSSWSAVEEKWTEQRVWIRTEAAKKDALIKENAESLSTLDKAEQTNILGWALANADSGALPADAESIIMELAAERISKPDPVEANTYFDKPYELLELVSKGKDDAHNGFWIELGPMRRFIAAYKGLSLFSNTSFAQAKEQFVAKLKHENDELADKAHFLHCLEDGIVDDERTLEYEIDYNLVKAGGIQALKTAMYTVLGADATIRDLETQIVDTRTLLNKLYTDSFFGINYDDPSALKKALQAVQKKRSTAFGALNQERIDKTQAQLHSANKVSDLSRQVFDLSSSISKLSTEIQELSAAYHQDVGENISAEDLDAAIDDLESVRQKAEYDEEQYREYYRNTASQFEETKTDRNPNIASEITERRFGFIPLERVLLGERIQHTSDIVPALTEANRSRKSIADNIRDAMTKVFKKTIDQYNYYEQKVRHINTFFHGRKISNQFFFKVSFKPHTTHNIDLLTNLSERVTNTYRSDELPMGHSIGDFIAEVYQALAKAPDKLPVYALLNPKTFFNLDVSLTDAEDQEIPGSSGETYSAIALLGIARLSLIDKENRQGLRFIILEEVGTLDNSNFETFPAVAQQYNYQIITMAPRPFSANISSEWHAYHLIKNKAPGSYNCPPMAYFNTQELSKDLIAYLSEQKQ